MRTPSWNEGRLLVVNGQLQGPLPSSDNKKPLSPAGQARRAEQLEYSALLREVQALAKQQGKKAS